MHVDAEPLGEDAQEFARRQRARWEFRRAEQRRRARQRDQRDPLGSGPEEGTSVNSPKSNAGPSERAAAAAAAPLPRREEASAAVDDTLVFPDAEVEHLRGRWRRLQGRFVDDPRAAVQDADALVEEALAALTERLAAHRQDLARQGGSGGDTEAMRVALLRYRSFLDQMLSWPG